MVTTLYLVRHGATEGSNMKRYTGSIDVPLSEEGIEQARKAALLVMEHLANSASSRNGSYLKDIHGKEIGMCADSGEAHRLSAVYCSDLARTVKSAEIIAQPYGLIPMESPHLRERSFGIWEGMTFLEIKEKYPDEFASWASNPVEYGPIEGESTLKVKERVVPELERIVKNHTGRNIAIVAHGGINRIVLCHILGMPLENIFRIEQDFGALNIIEFWDKYPVVKLLNGNGI